MSKTALFTIAMAICTVVTAHASPNLGEDKATVRDARTDSGEDRQQWRFRVKLGDRDIGYHEFAVDRQGEETEVAIQADFDVKILFFNAYSYRHQNQEVWRDDCLYRLESQTDDNGEDLRVQARVEQQGFVVETRTERFEDEAACIRSFAYWNPAILESERLLNSQTGELVDVEIVPEGNDAIEFNGERVAARKYAIRMKDGTISLWYAESNGQWLALEAPTPGGRVLRYEPVELPSGVEPMDELALR